MGEFVQVHLLTNIAPSKSAGDRSGAADTVIRRLFRVGAGIRVEMRGTRWLVGFFGVFSLLLRLFYTLKGYTGLWNFVL